MQNYTLKVEKSEKEEFKLPKTPFAIEVIHSKSIFLVTKDNDTDLYLLNHVESGISYINDDYTEQFIKGLISNGTYKLLSSKLILT